MIFDASHSKTALGWISVGLFMVMTALWLQLPWPIFMASSIFIMWRVLLVQKRLRKPNKFVKICLLMSSTLVLSYSVSPVISLQGCVSFLVLMASLKILESDSRRDYLLLVFLGCLMSACLLLFSRTILSFCYCLATMLILHVALIQSFSTRTKQRGQQHAFKTASVIFIQALPIALTLFVVLPRIGSLWTVPLNANVAKTGISDNLTAGDMERLSQDFSVAMRITFDGDKRPKKSQLYWRGMSLANFDGRTWNRAKQPAELSQNALQLLHNRAPNAVTGKALKQQNYRYQVMLEASGRPWLYALNTAKSRNKKLIQWDDYSLTRSTKVLQRYQYQLVSDLNFRDDSVLSVQQHQLFTKLPGEGNPKARAYAAALQAKYGAANEIVTALAKGFNADFNYTLAPGKSTLNNPIDDFLFASKRGYCEHFASASAFVLRAAGIPARIVTGYQGGQWSPDKNYLLVTQAQAHAWVEYWHSDRGWQRFDPTAAVAPQRIEQGNVEVLAPFNQGLDFVGRLRANSWLRHMQLNWDTLNYQWHRWVLGYNTQIQLDVVQRLLGGLDSWRIGLLLLAVMTLVTVPVMMMLWWPYHRIPRDPLFEMIKKLEKRLLKLKVHRGKSETLQAFLRRAALLNPGHSKQLVIISKSLERWLYRENMAFSALEKQQLERLISRLK